MEGVGEGMKRMDLKSSFTFMKNIFSYVSFLFFLQLHEASASTAVESLNRIVNESWRVWKVYGSEENKLNQIRFSSPENVK